MLDVALRQPCPPLPLLVDGTKAGVLLWSRDVVRLYDQCAAKDDAVLQAWPR